MLSKPRSPCPPHLRNSIPRHPRQILLGRQKYTSCCLGTGNAFFTLSGTRAKAIYKQSAWRRAAVEVFCSSLSRGNWDFERDVGSRRGTPAHADQRPGCARRGPGSRYLDFSTVGDQGWGLLGTPHLVLHPGSTRTSPFTSQRENAEEEEIMVSIFNVFFHLSTTLFQKSSKVDNRVLALGKGYCMKDLLAV